MWIIAILITSALSAASAASENHHFPALDPPTNLRVGKESPTTVLIRWNYEKPTNISLQKVEFFLVLEHGWQPIRKFYPKFRSEPFSYTINGLSPDTRYTVRLLATSLNWRDSAVASISFATLREDWPTPSIKRLSRTDGDDLVEYSVRWSISGLSLLLTHFEVEVCDDFCSFVQRNRSDTSGEVYLKYNTAFTVRVIACYNIPVFGPTKRFSKHVSTHTGKGSPERILKNIDAKKVGNEVTLGWLPSFGPTGPTVYYEFFVCDPTMKSSLPGYNVPPEYVKEDKWVPRMIDGSGDVYEMRLSDDDDRTTAISLPGTRVNQCAAPNPLLLVVVKRAKNAVRFRIVFQKPAGEDSSINENAAKNTSLRMGSHVAEAFGFPAYRSIHYGVRSCLTYEGRFTDVCGNFTAYESRSNAAQPSPVRSLDWDFKEADTVVLTWEAPAEPRGPIDGYKVLIRKTYGSSVRTKETMLNSTARSFVIERFRSHKSYEVGIAAYNLDSETGSEMLLGEWVYAYPAKWRVAINVGGVFILVMILCICVVSAALGRNR